ncbi:MAG: mechanosensitive ion channel [Burkholderiaceae bacterium]
MRFPISIMLATSASVALAPSAHAADNSAPWWSRSLFDVAGVSVSLVDLALALFIVLAAMFVSGLLQRGLSRLSARGPDSSRGAYYAIGRLLHYAIIVIGILVALAAIGIDVGKVTLLASAVGVGLGFGLQQIVNNAVSGIILLFERSLKVGDFVELESGVNGEVREINIRSTRITTPDNIDVLVPNSAFVSGVVTNWTLREASRRLRVPFGVAYGSDKDRVRQAALEAADEVPFTLKEPAERAPQVWLTNFGASSLDFELVIWLGPEALKKPMAVKAAYNWAIESALKRHGLEIPFPQSDLHLRSYFGLTGGEAIDAITAKSARRAD